MNANPSATEIETQMRTIVAESPTEPSLNGCDSPLEVYAYHLQKQIIEPLMAARAAEGLVSPLDDLGHDTAFVQAWNRAVAGQPEEWDCRLLAALFVNTATRNVPDLIEKIVTDDLDTLNEAVVANVAHYLSGKGMPAGSARSLKSWADGTLIQVRMEAFQPILETIKGTPLEAPKSLPASLDAQFDREDTPFEMVGIMSFHARSIDEKTSDAAWEAWRKKARSEGLMADRFWDSRMALMMRTVLSSHKMNISWQQLRSDEAISVSADEQGVMVYRGWVNGLKQIVDEGQFLCGPRSAFIAFLKEGGFSKEGADAYLDALTGTDSGFRVTVPGKSKMRIMTDAETLYGADMDVDETADNIEIEEAIPILAVGSFEMPEMIGHRERLAAAEVASNDRRDTDGPQ
ncbi:hypothetical protein KUV57_11270 [Epibacterium sp. DP7N7-1]|nr:hypothetical protein [Epibacterium sp. DP7N7-1]